MTSPSHKARWRTVCLVAAVVALGATLWFGWQFNVRGMVATRIGIVVSELGKTDGFGRSWQVPKTLRVATWHRVEVRILEAGKPLPFRVEDLKLVADVGMGRFGLENGSLLFSSTDNSDPVANGRNYEFEIHRPVYISAIWAAICLGAAVVLGLLALPRRAWDWLVGDVGKHGAGHVRLLRRLAILFALAAVFCMVQAWTPARIVGHERLAPARIVHETGNEYFYRLPRWVRSHQRAESAILTEDGKPLQRVGIWAWPSETTDGRCAYSSWRVSFRTSDGSNPALNGRSYKLTAEVFPPAEALGRAVFLAVLSLILFACAPEITRTRLCCPSLRTAGWWLVMLVVALAKLWLVAGDEVIADEADAHAYAELTLAHVWRGTDWMPTHPAGFPLVAGLVAQFGVPWRLAVEIFYLAACAGLAAVVGRLARSPWLRVALFAAMAWHPWTLTAFHDFMAYPIVLILSVGLLALMFLVLGQPSSQWRWRHFAGIGVLLFLWEWSRTEDPLVYAAYVLFAVLARAVARRESDPAPARRRRALLAFPFLLVLLLSTTVKLGNFSRCGIYAKSLINSPGLMALMKALYRVKPEEQLRYAPVTRQSLAAACQASLTLGGFEKALLDPQALATRYGQDITRRPGEFGPWLNWLLPQSLPANAQEANALMLQAAGEINSALRERRLPSQPAFFPLDPNWRLWLPDLLPCYVRSLGYCASLEAGLSWSGAWGRADERVFDLAANRRAAGANPRLLLGEGSIHSPPGVIDGVALTDQRGRLLGASAVTTNLSDGGLVFLLHANVPKEADNYGLEFFRAGRLVLSDLGHGLHPWTNAVVLSTGEKLVYSCAFSISEPPNKARFESWERRAPVLFKAILLVGLLISALALFLGRSRDQIPLARLLACLLLVTGLLVGRAALYGLIEANVGWGAERYMRCVSPLFVLVIFLATAAVVALIRKALPGGTEPQNS